MKLLLIVDHSNRFLQKKHRFDSLDINYIKAKLDKFYDVEIINYFELANNINNFKDHIIIYTGSQMEQYKNFIENIMFFAKDNNVIIPKYEILKSHENKFFQELYNRKVGIKTNIKTMLFGDVKEYQSYYNKVGFNFPVVIKGINGSASMNVRISKSYLESIDDIKAINANMVQGMNNDMPPKYDMFPKENVENRQFIMQEFINLPNYDYRIHIMGDKYWVHKRTLLEDSEYTSGDGSVNDYECDVPKEVLDYAKGIYEKLDTPHIIMDIVYNEGNLYLIEWSGLHLGLTSILGGKRHFIFEGNKWIKNEEENPKPEDEYINAWLWYLKKGEK